MIRRYRESDRVDLRDVCLRTAADGADATDLYTRPELPSLIYLDPYLTHDPSWTWVADDGARAIGYVTATADTPTFEEWCEREWWPPLRGAYPEADFPPGTPDGRMVRLIHHPRTTPQELADPYPAELHIDILPEGQGHGLGRRLMTLLLDALGEAGIRGVHLGVSLVNSGAVTFYRKLGFQELWADEWALGFGRSFV